MYQAFYLIRYMWYISLPVGGAKSRTIPCFPKFPFLSRLQRRCERRHKGSCQIWPISQTQDTKARTEGMTVLFVWSSPSTHRTSGTWQSSHFRFQYVQQRSSLWIIKFNIHNLRYRFIQWDGNGHPSHVRDGMLHISNLGRLQEY